LTRRPVITADATPGVNDQYVGRVLFANAQTLLGPRRVTESRLLQPGRRLSGTYSAGRSQQAMINLGMPETVADDSAKALSLFADYITDDVPSILGRSARSFEQFATDYSAVFS